MKILFVNVPAGQEKSEFGQIMKSAYVPLLQRNLNLVKQQDTEIVFRFCEWGLVSMEPIFYSYIDHLASRLVYYAAAHAQEEGFDAVVINCFGDPMVWELRQALDIPVVSIGESSMLLSAMMGLRFGIVSISEYNIPGLEERIAKYGLKERCAGSRAIGESGACQEEALLNAYHTIQTFTETARQLIADGAEIIIPGCSLMSPAVRFAPGAEKEYPNGLTEVDGVAVADIIGDTIKMAESLVALKKAGSSWISRKCLYARPTPEAVELGKVVTEGSGLKYWDVTTTG